MTAIPRQIPLLLPLDGWTFNYFAGGGGVCCGSEEATGRPCDVNVNHNQHAVTVHALNFPQTIHHRVDVWDICPVRDLPAGRCAWFWASPDCRHFSSAKGKAPLDKKIRGLAWVVLRVAAKRRPPIIFLENVREFLGWGPLNRGRRPIKKKVGHTFAKFVGQLTALGYVVEHRVVDAADFGTPSHRKRLILIARCDGRPIVWPEATHGPGCGKPWRSAAECIDWSVPAPSIFGPRKSGRPLAPKTLARIAEGIRRFVLNGKPFVVNLTHGGRMEPADEPLRTVTGAHRGEKAVVIPTLIQTGYGEREGQRPRAMDLHQPLGTVVAGGAKHALVCAYLVKHYGGVFGVPLTDPAGTVTAKDHHALATVSLGDDLAGALRVAAFMTKFYGTSTGSDLRDPCPSVTAQGQHLGLVTVTIAGVEHTIVDIGMRMLTPRELARAMGFKDSYRLVGSETDQIARIGNSVPPPLAAAHIRANVPAQARGKGKAA